MGAKTKSQLDVVTLGTKVFGRNTKLHQLLQSIPDSGIIDRVLVADDGHGDPVEIDETQIAADVPIDVLDLPFDAGLGAGREAIRERVETDYLLIVDADMEIPKNVATLQDVLEADDTLGGVGGLLNEGGQTVGLCHNLRESHDGRYLLRDAPENPQPESVADTNLYRWDFVPNAALFRTECLADYGWDDEYVIAREHLDFYVGHWHETDWEFGVVPGVELPHHPGGSDSYLAHRHNMTKKARSREYFRDKWGYDAVIHRNDWLDRGSDNPFRPLPSPPLSLESHARAKRLREHVERTLQGVLP